MGVQELGDSQDSVELDQPILVGNYELFSVLGEGGIATTYLGRALDSGRVVAVKAIQLLKSKRRTHIELFEREADALKSLNHPQIPTFIESLVTEGPESLTFYLVQEFVPGRSLQQVVKTGPLSSARVVSVMLNCLKPLEYLHSMRPPLYHRDIKPSNVILRSDNTCVLIDFGAVREALTDPTAAGSSVIGTFGYMAPEQFQGRVNAATDLYSLGATALELATGRHPSSFDVKRLKPDFHHILHLDSHLAAILDLLLEPAEEDRYRSVQSVRRALLRWVADHREALDEVDQRLVSISSSSWAVQPDPPVDVPADDETSEERGGRPVTRSQIIMVQDRDALKRATKGPSGEPDEEPALAEVIQSELGAVTPVGVEPIDVNSLSADEEPHVAEADRETPPSGYAIDERRLAFGGADGPPTRDMIYAPNGLDVPVRRRVDSWAVMFNPLSRGYLPIGGGILALSLLLFALSRLHSALSTALPIIAVVLAIYGLLYVLSFWLQLRQARGHRYYENTDGKLLGVDLKFTRLGSRYVVLDYGFSINGQPFRGNRVFSSRQEARPFLRNELPGMIWYDSANPRKNALDHE